MSHNNNNWGPNNGDAANGQQDGMGLPPTFAKMSLNNPAAPPLGAPTAMPGMAPMKLNQPQGYPLPPAMQPPAVGGNPVMQQPPLSTSIPQHTQAPPSFNRPPGPGMQPPVAVPHPGGMMPPSLGPPNPPGALPVVPPNHTGQQQQPGEISSAQQQPQQGMYGRPPVPVQAQVPNHIQPGMPPLPNAGAPNSSLSKQYPAYPQAPMMPPQGGQQASSIPQQTQDPPSFNRPPGPGMQPPGGLPHPGGMMPPLGPPNPSGGLPGVPPNHTGQQQQPGEISSSQQPQQGMFGRPPAPVQAQVPNHIQPGMPPLPNPGAPSSGSSLSKRYPAYPQAPMGGAGGMSNGAPTYPSYPQQPQQFQQPGMQPMQQPQADGGFYPGPGGVNTGAQYPRPPVPGPQGGMAQSNYPQYGQQPAAGGQYPQQGQGPPAYAQPSAQHGPKKLDPDQMPSAIGVMQDDQEAHGGLFRTDQKGQLPPLVTTKFPVEDWGNASPRFIRSTMYSVPAQPDMLKQTGVPFALVVNPFESPAKDEQPIPCVDLGPMGPVRCIRCKAYMSPLMQFIDGGRRFQCLLCKATTEVPPEYFQHLDHTGQRVDKWERPELCKGTYEYIATPEYCRNNVLPKEPGFIFVIDVSYNNVKSGLVSLLCSQMKNLVETLPTHTPIGFITYNSKVHFYNIDPTLGKPQMVIVPDVSDMFMPLLKGFLVPRVDAMDAIDLLMEQIPALFGDTKETEAVLGPAVVAGMEALKASDRAGKLLLFHSSLPTSDLAPGKLKNREADRKLLGTDKEKTVLTPQTTYYNNLGQDCVGAGVSVDLYLFNNSYVDVATIGQVARLTGGSVSKYTYFQSEIDGQRVIGDILYHLSRPIGFDSVMRVRTSTGVRPVDFQGHFFISNTTDVELAAIDSSKGIGVEIKHDASITDEDGVYIQIALLYTTVYGQRRLRVHNLALNTCMQMADLYRNCELDTIINFMAKQSISKSTETTPQDLKEGIIKRCAQMLATYRKHCANPSMPGQLILPECLKLLPLYTNCILRSDAVAGTSEITPDDRSWLMYAVLTMGVSSSVSYFYPRLVPIAGPNGSIDEPAPVRCSRDKLSEDSAFLLENGIYIFMWIGASVNPQWLQSIFGVSNLGQLNVETITELPDHVNSDESLRLRALIRSLRAERQRHMRLTIVRQRDKMELVMNRFLVEDRGTDGQPSYVDFLCHMHKEIRSILNQ